MPSNSVRGDSAIVGVDSSVGTRVSSEGVDALVSTSEGELGVAVVFCPSLTSGIVAESTRSKVKEKDASGTCP